MGSFVNPVQGAKEKPDGFHPSALYAMRYIATASLGKLYTFCVDPDVLLELEQIIHLYTARNTDKKFKSLQILEVMK